MPPVTGPGVRCGRAVLKDETKPAGGKGTVDTGVSGDKGQEEEASWPVDRAWSSLQSQSPERGTWWQD